MALLGIDLGGTKLAAAIFSCDGTILYREKTELKNRKGAAVGNLITGFVKKLLEKSEIQGKKILSVGISVPGIINMNTGRVWAPNIPGWTDYPLLEEVKNAVDGLPVIIDSDRACSILGEVWKGNAGGCRDAIFLAVGTGIGAGILVNGEVLRGSHDIAGAIGWMALHRPFKNKYIECGCFEYHASGEGIARVTRDFLREDISYNGALKDIELEKITSHVLFSAYEKGDPLAGRVIEECVELWGMAVANLVTLFNPEKIIFGGGIFGPASSLIPAIRKQASRWAQPVSITHVSMEVSGLGGDAGVYGAGYLAFKNFIRFEDLSEPDVQ